MEIVIVCSGQFHSTTSSSAAERRIRDYARGLASCNHCVTVVAPLYHNMGGLELFDEDFNVIYLGGPKLKGIKLWKKLEYQIALYKFALERISVIFFYNTRIDGGITSYFLKFKRKIFVINEFCDIFSHSQDSLLKKFTYKLDEYFVPKVSDLNIVISDPISVFVKLRSPEIPTLKIPVLVDSDLFKMSDKLNDNYRLNNKLVDSIIISYTGTFWKDYGVESLVQAFNRLLKEFDNIHLILAGPINSSIKQVDLPKIVNEMDLGAYISLTGWLNTPELVKLLCASDILVMPHLDTPFCTHGFPTKIAEYASIGKPIVSSRIGDLDKYFSDQKNILFYDSGDLEGLIECLRHLIISQSLRDHLGINAKLVSEEHFDYKKMGSRISDCITNMNDLAD